MSVNSGGFWLTLQLIFASAGAVFGYYVGGFDGFLRVLLAIVVLDYMTALALAAKEKRLSSDIGFWGIFKKILIFAVVAIANLIDNEIVYTGDMLRNAAVFFYLSNEGLSVLENCAALGLLIPEGMRIALLKFRNNKHNNTVHLEVPEDQIDEVYKLKQVIEDPTEKMTNAMIDELTDGRRADDIYEQPSCGVSPYKPE